MLKQWKRFAFWVAKKRYIRFVKKCIQKRNMDLVMQNLYGIPRDMDYQIAGRTALRGHSDASLESILCMPSGHATVPIYDRADYPRKSNGKYCQQGVLPTPIE